MPIREKLKKHSYSKSPYINGLNGIGLDICGWGEVKSTLDYQQYLDLAFNGWDLFPNLFHSKRITVKFMAGFLFINQFHFQNQTSKSINC